ISSQADYVPSRTDNNVGLGTAGHMHLNWAIAVHVYPGLAIYLRPLGIDGDGSDVLSLDIQCIRVGSIGGFAPGHDLGIIVRPRIVIDAKSKMARTFHHRVGNGNALAKAMAEYVDDTISGRLRSV